MHGILARFPMIKVVTKPIADGIEEFQKSIIVNRRNPDPKTLIIDNHRNPLRIGAFEVHISAKRGDRIEQELLHSKLASKTWPSIGNILNRIGKKNLLI